MLIRVTAIRFINVTRALKSGATQTSIANKYAMSQNTVRMIKQADGDYAKYRRLVVRTTRNRRIQRHRAAFQASSNLTGNKSFNKPSLFERFVNFIRA